MTLVAYFDSPDLKQLYINRMTEHQRLDQLVQGQGHFTDGKGCAVACTMHAYDHAAYETEIGVPQVLARLEDYIFEGLATDEAKRWPLRFLAAIPVGADLSMVWPRFAVWLLREELKSHDKGGHCEKVAALYDRWISGVKPPVEEWRAARSAAAYYAAADAYAAYAADAAYAAAAYATDAAYAAATYAAADAYAAYAAAAAGADYARRSFWLRAASKLEQLLTEAPLY
jgi:hypothetical protein